MRDYERKAIADAAYDAWYHGRNYDAAWDRAEQAVERAEPYGYWEAYDAAGQAAMREPEK